MEAMYAHADLIKVYKALMDSTLEIGTFLRYHTSTMTMEKNPLGKELADIDLKADEIIFNNLEKSKVVHSAMSNNRPSVNVLNEDAEYIVTFDPIDGSHVIDSNFSIASVYAIWQCTDINGKTGRDLVGACLAIYGSRTTIVVYNN